jgi:glycosyltransferase involved in cell wall biosynthesis
MTASAKAPKTVLLAKISKGFLIGVARPITGLLGACGGKTHNGAETKTPLPYRLVSPIARLINWAVQGAITLSQPTMNYDPIEWRRKRLECQWAAQITGVGEEDLDAQSRDYLARQQSVPPSATTSDIATFTVLVGFHTHINYFQQCIESIVKAHEKSPDTFLELLLVNDDPNIDSTSLEQMVSKTPLQALIRSNKVNLGICRSINDTIPHARGEWILYLDCDDRLHPDAIVSLCGIINSHPGIRFISSRSVDIDEQGRILAYRLRDESPIDLIQNNYASHLKAIRRDLHEDIGSFDSSFEGCQDFEFALRAALFERLLFIPDYLYEYRWHGGSQTVGNCNHQNEVMLRVRQTYLLGIHWILNGIQGIGINISGIHAEEWAKKIPASAGHHHWIIDLEACSPFSQHLHKLLMIRIANRVIEAVSTGKTGPLPKITV